MCLLKTAHLWSRNNVTSRNVTVESDTLGELRCLLSASNELVHLRLSGKRKLFNRKSISIKPKKESSVRYVSRMVRPLRDCRWRPSTLTIFQLCQSCCHYRFPDGPLAYRHRHVRWFLCHWTNSRLSCLHRLRIGENSYRPSKSWPESVTYNWK